MSAAATLRERLAAAEARCARAGANLTELRRDVLEMILAAPAPSTAYQLLDRLRARRGSGTPPTVYRTLDFLLEQRLIHRVERLGAFVGCVGEDGHSHQAQFLICARCHAVAELEDDAVEAALAHAAAAAGFALQRSTIEVEGLCASCRAAAAGASR